MHSLRRVMWAILAPGLMMMVAGFLVGCDNSTSSEPQIANESDLDFVQRVASAPPLETLDTSFWAVRGQDRELEIRYAGQDGQGTGKEFLSFVVEEQTLLRRPDGSSFADGDSVEIRVSVDPDLFLLRFEPSGLQFNPNEPAKLELDYDEAEPEFLAREGEIAMWRQEQAGDPWERIGTVQVEELDEIEALLTGFTRYALAVGR